MSFLLPPITASIDIVLAPQVKLAIPWPFASGADGGADPSRATQSNVIGHAALLAFLGFLRDGGTPVPCATANV